MLFGKKLLWKKLYVLKITIRTTWNKNSQTNLEIEQENNLPHSIQVNIKKKSQELWQQNNHGDKDIILCFFSIYFEHKRIKENVADEIAGQLTNITKFS